jgi:glycosyltransferase involved in cell wall biosynthesis
MRQIDTIDVPAEHTSVAVLIACLDEAASIGRVVRDFQRVLPDANIYVYDNNSTDDTTAVARSAGAIVRRESLQGKGHVMRRMFADVDADIYIMVDGDDTYDAGAAEPMVRLLRDKSLDMVNGRRVATGSGSHRKGHRFGNWLLSSVVALIFGKRLSDMLSGYKVLSRRFVKSFPCLSSGFEIETEIAVHALELMMPLEEIPVAYRERESGSESKLHTIRDGLRISWTILRLLRAERPLRFFGSIFLILTLISSFLGLELFLEWRATGLVLRMPTAVLCTGMMLLGFLSLACGMVLETVTLGRREFKRMVYLGIPPVGNQVGANPPVFVEPLVRSR